MLRSLSDHPDITEKQDILHKIGVTKNDVKKRISNAKNDPTFLLSDVEVVATYKLSNINRTKLERLLHKFLSSARMDVEIKDRFGKPVIAREWFLVPIFVIDEIVEKIRNNEISNYHYDVKSASLKKN